MYESLIRLIRSIYGRKEIIGLHEPCLGDKEREYVLKAIDSTYVSTSFSPFVEQLENGITSYTGAEYAVATVNGTCALHILLYALGVGADDEVLTQSFGFVATTNAIRYVGAHPVFIDIDPGTLGMSANALQQYLEHSAIKTKSGTFSKSTGRRLKACAPIHIFGHPLLIDEVVEICESYQIEVIEDAAESLGSRYKDKHTGTFGKAGVLSFNGNKIVTAGGGGMILTDSQSLAGRLKHLSTTAKVNKTWHFEHDEVGFNYRMPNLNAALACAQLENLDQFMNRKREIASVYLEWGRANNVSMVEEPNHCRSNYWLNTIVCEDEAGRDKFLDVLNAEGIYARPAWKPMHLLPMCKQYERGNMTVTESMYNRVVNLPSSVS